MPMWLVGKKMNEEYVAVSVAKNHFSVHFSDEASLRTVETGIGNFLNLYRFEGSASQ